MDDRHPVTVGVRIALNTSSRVGILSVFERYPKEDGFGVIWGVLHGLESLRNYEQELLRSLARQPSEFGVCMVGRLLNAGIREVGGISLLDTLRELAVTAKSPRIRETAVGLVSRNNRVLGSGRSNPSRNLNGHSLERMEVRFGRISGLRCGPAFPLSGEIVPRHVNQITESFDLGEPKVHT